MIFLKIHQQFARIGIERHPHTFELNISKPVLEMRQHQPRLAIRQARTELEIDSTYSRAAYGQKSRELLNREFIERAKREALEGIARRAEEGDRLAEIENPASTIPVIAEEASRPAEGSLELVYIPFPDISWKFAPVDVKLVEGDIEYNFRPGDVAVNSTPGFINVYLRQKPYVKFEYAGQHFDKYV